MLRAAVPPARLAALCARRAVRRCAMAAPCVPALPRAAASADAFVEVRCPDGDAPMLIVVPLPAGPRNLSRPKDEPLGALLPCVALAREASDGAQYVR